MGVRQQATEPWGIVTACLLGGLGGAVTSALTAPVPGGLLAGLAIGGAVYGVRLGLALLTEGRGSEPADHLGGVAGDGLPEPAPGGPAAQWLRRASTAVGTLHRLSADPGDPVVRLHAAGVAERATEALTDLRRLAGQATLVERAMAGLPHDRLLADRRQVQAQLAGAPPGTLREQLAVSLRAIDDQLAAGERLSEAHGTLLARLQAATLGLEGLGVRLAEVMALRATAGADQAQAGATVAGLAGDLDGLRAGLAEAEALSRAALERTTR